MSPGKAEVQGTLIAEFVDQATPASNPPRSRGEVVRPSVLHWFTESAQPRVDEKSFTVLLRGLGTVTVRGYSLLEKGHFVAVLSRESGSEVTVALFPIANVDGVFAGTLTASGPSA
jgi:hypothetical protein